MNFQSELRLAAVEKYHERRAYSRERARRLNHLFVCAECYARWREGALSQHGGLRGIIDALQQQAGPEALPKKENLQ